MWTTVCAGWLPSTSRTALDGDGGCGLAKGEGGWSMLASLVPLWSYVLIRHCCACPSSGIQDEEKAHLRGKLLSLIDQEDTQVGEPIHLYSLPSSAGCWAKQCQ